MKTDTMRLWSIHPRYLDVAGLTACWREGLLARAVLAGNTTGYRNHPQLVRFRACAEPVVAVDTYLAEVLDEALRRGYRFDLSKIGPGDRALRFPVTTGQLEFERRHLLDKLRLRAPHMCRALESVSVDAHPLFAVTEGEVENWEIR